MSPSDIADGHPLVLYFMRAADCAVCRRHVKQLVAAGDELQERGARVAVVVPDGIAEAAEVKASLDVPYRVVSGANGSAHAGFGLHKAVFGQLQQSGTVLLDGAGVVRHVTAATLPIGALNKSALLRDLDALQAVRVGT